MADADHVRLGRIAEKLAAARAVPMPPTAFGAPQHGFKVGDPLPEAEVAAYEERHEVALPAAYRLFVTELGDGGAGPGYHLSRLSAACYTGCQPGHLARPSPYLPGPRYPGDWERRHEEPPGPGRTFLSGTLTIAHHGCALVTQLVVTGPSRGRLLNVDYEGSTGPYVVEDAGFLVWYERWLDEAVAGYDVGWFGERLPVGEPGLIAALAGDPSPERRARAAHSLLQLPTTSAAAWTALADAMAGDVSATVRATAFDCLRSRERKDGRALGGAEAIADEIAEYARSCAPPGLEALALLSKATLADALAELAADDLERRRRAAYRLTELAWRSTETARPGSLSEAAACLLDDADPLLRLHGVTVARRARLADLEPRLRQLDETETDPWVRFELSWQPPASGGFRSPAAHEFTGELPF
jgi:hypothetical protein